MYQGDYELIGSELSFFTRKLEAQLRFQRIPWRYQFKTQDRSAELEARAGTHFIPLLQTPDRWLLSDTIAIGPLLNDRFNSRTVIPNTPTQRATCFILEDAFNHWLGKSCLHSRWCYPENVRWIGIRFGANLMLDRSISEPVSEQEEALLSSFGLTMHEGFGKHACEVNGVGPDAEQLVKADFQAMLKALASHLKNHAFLLRPRPCLADFALAGAFKAHYTLDPEPRSWLRKHEEALSNYTNRLFTEPDHNLQPWFADDQLPESLTVILDYLQSSYFTYANANLEAITANEKYVIYDYGGFGKTRSRSQRRLNHARLHVADELLRCNAKENTAIQEVYSGTNILDYYFH
jgi:glutathione S-transferase